MARNIEFNEEKAIQKAMEVFWKKGYAGASLRNLTDAMQINSSSLYNTIGDKHQLFVKCIKNYTEMRMEEAKKLVATTKSPFTALIDLINYSANIIISSEIGCMVVKTTFEIAADDKDIQAILKKDIESTHDFLRTLIINARELGEIAEGEDPEMLTDYVLSIFTGWYKSYAIHQDPIRIRKMAKYLINQLSH